MVHRFKPVLSSRATDNLVIPVNVWSPSGLSRLDSIEWLPLGLSQIPEIPISQKVLRHDPMRICEVESVANWGPTQSATIFQIIEETQLTKNFKLRSLYTSGYDIVYIKAVFEATTEGS